MRGNPTKWVRAELPCDIGHAFAVRGGGRLLVSPGRVRCRVAFGEVRIGLEGPPVDLDPQDLDEAGNHRSEAADETFAIACRFELADRQGDVFRYERWVRGDTFFFASLLGDHTAATRISLTMLGEAGHSNDFYRRDTPIYQPTATGWSASSYYLPHGSRFRLFIESREVPPDRLVIELKEQQELGSRLPPVKTATELSAVIALWSSWLMPYGSFNQFPAVFARAGSRADAEPLIEFAPI